MGLAFAIFGDVEGSAFDVEYCFGTDPDCGHECGVQVGDGDRIFDSDTRSLVGCFSVDKSFFVPPPQSTTLEPPVKCLCNP